LPLPAPPPTLDSRNLPRRISVLILDDQRFDRHRLARLCSGLPLQTDIENANSLATMSALLDTNTFDLIFVDYNLPDGSGLDALDQIAKSQRNKYAASIMVTGHEEEPIALGAMERGCTDYITKDELSSSSFNRAVTNALQKLQLNRQVAAQTFARTEVEGVLQDFASQCANDIKPMVSRMMRQLRMLRDAPATDHARLQKRRQSVEDSCMHLWEFLDALESHQADLMMKDLAAKSARAPDPSPFPSEPAQGLDAVTDQPRAKRSPSPFSSSTKGISRFN
tara:strand:+ start:241 stop:1080 length:840 start_codon:yes stop_codon:yes gene_type:complete